MTDNRKSDDFCAQRTAELRVIIESAQRELRELSGADSAMPTHNGGPSRAPAESQLDILNALPAHIALLDSRGVIVAVNEGWRRFAAANILRSADFCVGQNYLDLCEHAHGECADEAPAVASGLRRVLRREAQDFALEYPCHSPTEKRWFRLMAAALSEQPDSGVVVMHINVTDRRFAEEGLRKLTRAVEQSPATIVITDLAGNIDYVNPKFTEVTGYSAAEVMGKNPRIMQSGKTPLETYRALWATITAGREWRGELHNRKKNGETYWEEVSIAPVQDATGKPTHFVAVKEDITARKQEEMVRAWESRVLEAVSSGTPLAAVLTEIALGIEAAIDGAIASILLPDQDGMHLRCGAAPNLPETYSRAILGAPIGPAAGSCGTAIYRREPVIVGDIEQDPLWRDYRELAAAHGLRACWSVPVINAMGQVLASFAVYYREPRLPRPRDLELIRRTVYITGIAVERDRKDKELRLLEACVARLNDIILITEAEPIEGDGPRILYVNDAFVRRTGYAREEAIGKTPRILQGPKTQRDALDRIRVALKAWQPVREELINYTKSGEEFWLELDIVPLADEKGWFTHWIAVERDISERKKAEAATLQAARQLRESETQYRLLFNSNPQPMWVFDDETLQFLAVNQAAVAHYGYSEDEFLAMTLKDIRPPEEVPSLIATLSTSRAADREGYVGAWRHRKKDGTLIDVEIVFSLIEFDGRRARLTLAHDITERLRVQNALATSEAEFRNLAEAMPQIVWVTNADGSVLYFNRNWMQYTGYSLDEGFGDGWIVAIHPDDRQPVLDAWQRATSTLDTYSIECRLRRADGEYRWWLIRGAPQRDAVGKVLKWFGTCTDIHTLKQADLEISRINRALKLLSGCNEALVRADNARNLMLAVCQMAVDIGGYRMAWVGYAQKDADSRIAPVAHAGAEDGFLSEIKLSWDESHPGGQGAAGRCIRLGEAVVCEDIQDRGYSTVWRPAAQVRGYRGFIALPLNEAGRTFGLLGLYTAGVIERNEEELQLLRELADDLAFGIAHLQTTAEQKRADAKVREQAALLDSAHDAIMVKDMQDRLVYWNKGAQQLYGWTAQESLGSKSCDLLHVDPDRFRRAYDIVLEQGEWKGELHKRTKNGVDVTLDVSWTLVRDATGEATSIFAIDSDITEKRKIESQLLRAQRMESIGTLAGGIAHDLNNVLAPIVMSIEVLKDITAREQDQYLLDTLLSSALRGRDLIKQVLTFARGVKGERVAVDVAHLLRELVNVLRDTFPKNIRVDFQAPRSVWSVSGDPTQIHQVVLNLCVNARDAMPKGGELIIATDNVRLDDTSAGLSPDALAGPYVVITVEDNGVGMSQALKDRIFEPFFTTKDVGQGTGLGLSTTMAIVKSHGGFIVVYSELGRGTKFNVYLPADASKDRSGKDIAGTAVLPRGNGELILVVDDEQALRTIAQSTLQRFGYNVMLAANGAEAIALYTRHRQDIAVVLTDMSMPIMDGPALSSVLRDMSPGVRIVGSSGLAESSGRAHAPGGVVEHFLLKPYTAEALLKTLRAVLDGN